MKNKRIDEINQLILKSKKEGLIETKDITDGYHTFEDYRHHRIILFSIICNTYKEYAWKSRKHYNEDVDPISNYSDSFIAGINTPMGVASYHIKLKYWSLFDVKEISNAPLYDGYSSDDVLVRLLSLTKEEIKTTKNNQSKSRKLKNKL